MISKDEKAIMLYESIQAEIRDQLIRIKSAEEKGRERGKLEGKIETAISFLKLGVNEEIVTRGTDLSVEKVLEIKKDMLN